MIFIHFLRTVKIELDSPLERRIGAPLETHGPDRKSPTIQDVARHANVSSATVSRVLSTPERVSEPTRQRVHAAVRETGYTVNQAARSLRMQRAKTILAAMPAFR